MGAEAFETRASGKTASEAFNKAVDHARYMHGHRGYTGTIAEKTGFQVEIPRAGETPIECVRRCADDGEHFSDDKWGPAGCVDWGPDPANPGERLFIFFGWASS